MTALEQIIIEIDKEIEILNTLHSTEIKGRKIGLAFAKRIVKKVKTIEKKNLLDISFKSALYEREWLYKEMSGNEYKPSKIEIRDLKKSALEHYNETFKSK